MSDKCMICKKIIDKNEKELASLKEEAINNYIILGNCDAKRDSDIRLNRKVLRECFDRFPSYNGIDIPREHLKKIDDWRTSMQILLKKLSGSSKPLRYIRKDFKDFKLEEPIAIVNPTKFPVPKELEKSEEPSDAIDVKELVKTLTNDLYILVEKEDLQFSELREEIEKLIEYVDQYTHITPSHRAIQILNEFRKKYLEGTK